MEEEVICLLKKLSISTIKKTQFKNSIAVQCSNIHSSREQNSQTMKRSKTDSRQVDDRTNTDETSKKPKLSNNNSSTKKSSTASSSDSSSIKATTASSSSSSSTKTSSTSSTFSSSSDSPRYPAQENMAWHRDMNRRHGLGPGANGTSNVRKNNVVAPVLDAVASILLVVLSFFQWCEIYRMSYRHFVQNAKQLAENKHIDSEIAYRASMLPSCDYGLQCAMKYYGYTYTKNSPIAWAITAHSKKNMNLMQQHVRALKDGKLPEDMSCWITLDEPWMPRLITPEHRCPPIPYNNLKEFKDALEQLILNDRFNWLMNM